MPICRYAWQGYLRSTDEAGLQNALNSSTDVTYDGSKLAKAANVNVPAEHSDCD